MITEIGLRSHIAAISFFFLKKNLNIGVLQIYSMLLSVLTHGKNQKILCSMLAILYHRGFIQYIDLNGKNTKKKEKEIKPII